MQPTTTRHVACRARTSRTRMRWVQAKDVPACATPAITKLSPLAWRAPRSHTLCWTKMARRACAKQATSGTPVSPAANCSRHAQHSRPPAPLPTRALVCYIETVSPVLLSIVAAWHCLPTHGKTDSEVLTQAFVNLCVGMIRRAGLCEDVNGDGDMDGDDSMLLDPLLCPAMLSLAAPDLCYSIADCALPCATIASFCHDCPTEAGAVGNGVCDEGSLCSWGTDPADCGGCPSGASQHLLADYTIGPCTCRAGTPTTQSTTTSAGCQPPPPPPPCPSHSSWSTLASSCHCDAGYEVMGTGTYQSCVQSRPPPSPPSYSSRSRRSSSYDSSYGSTSPPPPPYHSSSSSRWTDPLWWIILCACVGLRMCRASKKRPANRVGGQGLMAGGTPVVVAGSANRYMPPELRAQVAQPATTGGALERRYETIA